VPAGTSNGVWGDASVTSGVVGGEVCAGNGCAVTSLARSVDLWKGSSWEKIAVFSDEGGPSEGDSTLGNSTGYPAGRPARVSEAPGRGASLLAA
jgi:hypothetical protein